MTAPTINIVLVVIQQVQLLTIIQVVKLVFVEEHVHTQAIQEIIAPADMKIGHIMN